MKLPDFKKYIFSYTTIALSLRIYYLVVILNITDFPPVNHNDFITPQGALISLIVLDILFYLVSLGLLVLEILIHKFVINKYFPNLEPPVDIKIPIVVSKIYSYIFYAFFIVSLVLLNVILWFLVYCLFVSLFLLF